MTACPIVARIWDYGWLAGDEVRLPSSGSDRELLVHYVASPAFHTSFLPSDKDETGIHGPFVAGRLVASDFEPLGEAALDGYLKALLYSPEWDSPASPEQFGEVFEHLETPFSQNLRCYVLRFDETCSDMHHDWGFVLTAFRELLFLGHSPDLIKRFVIGYD